MALGGSTNAVLHLLAIAREAEVDLTLDDFNRIGDRVPHLGDLEPFGRYVMTDVDRVGGIPVIMRALLDAGLLHGDCLTVTGKTMAENLADIAPPDVDGTIIRALDKPIHGTGGITILHGSLAPEGAVVKSAGFDSDVFEGTARVFDGERAAMDAVADLISQRRRRDPVRRPEGRPRHARDARGHRRDQGRWPRQGRPAPHRRPLLGRYDGTLRGSRGAGSRRRRPDRLRPGRRPDHPRRQEPHPRPPRRPRGTRTPPRGLDPEDPAITKGVLGKYTRLVRSASEGAVCI